VLETHENAKLIKLSLLENQGLNFKLKKPNKIHQVGLFKEMAVKNNALTQYYLHGLEETF